MKRGEDMPDTYAHYTFGQKVLANLDKDTKNFVLENIDIFNIGLQGPDIFFYYKPFFINRVNSVGYKLHNEPASIFFKRAKAIIKSSSKIDSAKSYIAGFICHFILDSECHPIINHLTDNFENYSHSEIETEFYRLLLEEDNHDPINYRVAEHLTINEKVSEQIALFFPQKTINGQNVIKSVEAMKMYSVLMEELSQIKLIRDREDKKRRGVFEFAKGLIMKTEPQEQYLNSNFVLKDLYTRAISPTANLIEQYFESINSNKLNRRFNRTFN